VAHGKHTNSGRHDTDSINSRRIGSDPFALLRGAIVRALFDEGRDRHLWLHGGTGRVGDVLF
jgi:hypothetical protein